MYTKEAHYQKMDRMMKNFEDKCKIKQKGVGEYSLSMMDLPLSPKSYGRPSNLPHKYNDHFVRASTSSAMDEEDNEILNWLYKDEESSAQEKRIQNISIPTHQYGKGFQIMQKIGYKGRGPLGERNAGLIEPIEMTWRDSKMKTGVGYLEEGYTKKHYPILYDQILQLESHSDEDSNEWE